MKWSDHLQKITIFIYHVNLDCILHDTFQATITCSKLTIGTLEQSCEICSKLTIKTPKERRWRRFDVFIANVSSVSIVNFEQVNASWYSTSHNRRKVHPLIFHTKLFALYKYYNTQYGAVAAGNYSLSKRLEFSNFERTLDLL